MKCVEEEVVWGEIFSKQSYGGWCTLSKKKKREKMMMKKKYESRRETRCRISRREKKRKESWKSLYTGGC